MLYRKRKLSILPVLLALAVPSLLLTACEEEYPFEGMSFLNIDGTDTTKVVPTIDTVRVTYDAATERFFIEAEVSDPQGLSDVDSVSVKAYRPRQIEPASFSGVLLDDGMRYDIIAGDGRFSGKTPMWFAEGLLGSFRFKINAEDTEGNVSGEHEIVFNTNSPPLLSLVSVTDTVVAGDTIFIEVKVSDPDGLSDIRSANYRIRRPDGTIATDPSFALRDDGTFGDVLAGDGIYSVKQPTNPPPEGATGVFTFLVVAKDAAGEESDELKIPVTLVI